MISTTRWMSRVGITALVFLLSVLSAVLVWADGTPAVPAGAPAGGVAAGGAPLAAQQPGMASMLVPFALMFGVVYFLMIRPQQKKLKEHQDLLSKLEHGDEIVTSAGIIGKVTGITDKVVTLEIADNVRIKVMKSQVAQVVKGQIKDLA